MVSTTFSIITMVALGTSISLGGDFICPDEQSKQLDEERWKISADSGDRASVDRAIDALVELAARANRPEDRFVLQRTCNRIGYILLDEGLVDEKSSSLDGCPVNTIEQIVRGREEHKEFYGEDPYLPIVRVAPVWPPKALEQQLSGEVVFEFTVTRKGRVKNLRIVESSNEIFNRNALAAAKKLRYKPKEENGKPIETAGVRNRVVFDYEQLMLDEKLGDCRLAARDNDNPQPPVFVYSFTGNPDLDDVVDRSDTMADGVLVSILLDLGERANRPDVAALQAALGKLSQRERFENTLGCVFVGPGEPCQPIVFLTRNPLKSRAGVDELFARLDEHKMTSAWLIYVIEQAHQGGYSLSLTAHKLSRVGDELDKGRQAVAMYRDLFSNGSDAHARGLSSDDRSVSPKIGSKDARGLYWISGEPPRIEALVRESPQGAADMLRYLLAITEDKNYKEFKAIAKALPRARDANLYGGEKCRARAGICNMHVVDRTDDRVRVLWAPGRDVPYMMSFNIPGLH